MGRRRATRAAHHHRERDERGAGLVEMAIILPVIVLLTFGIIEFSRMFNAKSTVSQAARAGGRIASAQPLSPTLTQTAADAVGSVLARMEPTAPQEVWIYRVVPNGDGEPPPSCTSECVRYRWDEDSRSFVPEAGSWDTTDRHLVCDGSFYQVGVYVQTDVAWLTSLFSGDLTRSIDDWSVFRFEPVTSEQCAEAS